MRWRLRATRRVPAPAQKAEREDLKNRNEKRTVTVLSRACDRTILSSTPLLGKPLTKALRKMGYPGERAASGAGRKSGYCKSFESLE
jgi:hypothetical protein